MYISVLNIGDNFLGADRPDLVAADVGWTSAHRLQGVTYLYLRLTYNRDTFPRGIPNIKAVVKGRKL